MINLKHLSDTQFEEFCFDLLKSLDFTNISWRKGTGLDTSPSDQGRDLQADYIICDIDGTKRIEKYYIECKHHLKGVALDKIQGALAWANSERPNVLLIIVSNWLSNPTKNYLDDYINNNKPIFRIKVWENKDIENLIINKIDIQKKYSIDCEISFLKYINKYHLIYSLKPQMNTYNYLIELMDQLDQDMRDKAFDMVYFSVIKPRFREPVDKHEKIGDLIIDKVDYSSFRKKILDSHFIEYEISWIVCSMLSWAFHQGDISSIDYAINKNKELIENLKKDDLKVDEIEKQNFIKKIEDITDNIPSKIENNYKIYNYICENLIRKLLSEKPIIKNSAYST